MAIDRWTTVRGERFGDVVALRSEHEALDVEISLDVADPAGVQPPWGRYVAGVVAELRPPVGLSGRVSSTVPVGSGLSSSAALEVAVALALGVEGPPVAVAALCQRAEQRASGVPCGIMDQLASVAGVEGAALLIDCHTLDVRAIPLPPADEVEVVVVHSGVVRSLAGSAYADRAKQCANAERIIGPLRSATASDVERIAIPSCGRRARHVITENQRVGEFAAALVAGDLVTRGTLMLASHASLRDDFEVSTTELDELVVRLRAVPGVFGARLTGAGFGGCVVCLARPGAVTEGWVVRPVAGASVGVPAHRRNGQPQVALGVMETAVGQASDWPAGEARRGAGRCTGRRWWGRGTPTPTGSARPCRRASGSRRPRPRRGCVPVPSAVPPVRPPGRGRGGRPRSGSAAPRPARSHRRRARRAGCNPQRSRGRRDGAGRRRSARPSGRNDLVLVRLLSGQDVGIDLVEQAARVVADQLDQAETRSERPM